VYLVGQVVVVSEGRPTDRRNATPRRRGGPSSQLTRCPPDEDIVGGGVEHPVVTLARVVVVPGYLDEALVEREVVTDRVLPALLVVSVVGEVTYDELIDPVQCEPLF